ncbi:Lactate/malate dehydrogenase family protein [Dorcoceras hygrometricum]|uniref:Lactate/malate dehydrogenase family protein n=1 Tax=Dorcoceras hygrometricum TaxID=472368 RepID=A0A2Z6ZX85_9LAMI|nr:Lactate/malate dehydrogenase family protein [Dorcoceras hygrometricum]
MGNTDPHKTKAGNKYEFKPQYEELSNSYACNMLKINAMKCMWLSKEIGQLGQSINRQFISSRLNTTVYKPGNHRSVIIGARQPITARRRDFPEMLKSVTGTQYLSSIQLHNHVNPTARSILQSYTSTQALTTKNRAQTTRNAHPKAQKKRRQNLLNETNNSRKSRAFGISQLVTPSFQTSINGKRKSQGVQRHQERQKQRLESTGNGD